MTESRVKEHFSFVLGPTFCTLFCYVTGWQIRLLNGSLSKFPFCLITDRCKKYFFGKSHKKIFRFFKYDFNNIFNNIYLFIFYVIFFHVRWTRPRKCPVTTCWSASSRGGRARRTCRRPWCPCGWSTSSWWAWCCWGSSSSWWPSPTRRSTTTWTPSGSKITFDRVTLCWHSKFDSLLFSSSTSLFQHNHAPACKLSFDKSEVLI